MNSEPPSTWIALTAKGMRWQRVSRKAAALREVARLLTATTSQREITSMAVKCLRITPGSGRTSRVSTCTRSPGRLTE